MTDERYHAYRQVLSALATDGAAVLTTIEREVLCDAAEGYLLMRFPNEDEAAELTANVAAVLGGLVGLGPLARRHRHSGAECDRGVRPAPRTCRRLTYVTTRARLGSDPVRQGVT